MSEEMDQYREEIAAKPLGELVDELLQLRLYEPDGAKAQITNMQKIREVVYQLNQREVVDDGKEPKPRRNNIGSLKTIL